MDGIRFTVTVNEDIHGSMTVFMFMFILMFMDLCMCAWLGVSVCIRFSSLTLSISPFFFLSRFDLRDLYLFPFSTVLLYMNFGHRLAGQWYIFLSFISPKLTSIMASGVIVR